MKKKIKQPYCSGTAVMFFVTGNVYTGRGIGK